MKDQCSVVSQNYLDCEGKKTLILKYTQSTLLFQINFIVLSEKSIGNKTDTKESERNVVYFHKLINIQTSVKII